MPRYVWYVVRIVLLFFIYVITARFGFGFDAVSGFATLFWLPTGISLAALTLWGLHFWPAIAAGAFVANMLQGAPSPVAAGITLGNTGEALLGAFILKRFHFDTRMTKISDVFILIYAATVSTLLSASVGVTSLQLGQLMDLSQAGPTWLAWWTGDFISALIKAPLLLAWSDWRIVRHTIGEFLLLVILVMIIGLLLFSPVFGRQTTSTSLTYLVFPPLIWAALRFSPREVITGVMIFSLFAVIGTAQGYGPFVHNGVSQSLMFVQSFMGVIAITSLILAAAISERKQYEQRKDEFISIASHELKTPLTSVRAYVQILSKLLVSQKRSKVRTYVDKLDKQLQRLMRLVNDLLDLSRIQTEQVKLTVAPFSLDQMAKETLSMMRTTTKNHHLVLRGKSNHLVLGDRERLRQVLVNLLTNAIKFAPPKSRIDIHIYNSPNKVIVSVKDVGKGIDPIYQHHIFDRFVRLDDGTSPQGLGVGLFIAREIVKRHGGDMWVDSSPGQGSTFSFSIPFYQK